MKEYILCSSQPHPQTAKMKLSFLILGLVWSLASTLKCPNLTAYTDSSLETICICDSGDGFNGWEATCLNTSNFIQLFNLKYVVDSDITFICGELEPYMHGILEQLPSTNIHTFVFKSCSLPNTSYSEILDGYHVEQLKIEMKRDNRTFSGEMFQNISNGLTSLILSNNAILSLPDTIFSNFTHLKFLSLSDNMLSTLPGKIFLDLPNLVVLEMANNRIDNLPQNLFQGLFQLERLYLYKNRLKRLPEGLFESLVNLKVLDLADNHLILLPNNIFLGLSQLIHVRLKGNWLEILPKELFSYSSNLQEIDLSFNKFMEPLPEELFYGLVRLENVSVYDCNLTHIHETFFAHCPNITHLKLQNNVLSSLPQDVFKNNTKLKELNLNFNFISELPENLFSNHKNLQKLHLFKNSISKIPDDFFKNARSVKTLVLGRNRIQNASQVIFRNLPSLESIDLSINNLTHFSLDFNEHIKFIDLSHNSLTEMPEINWLQHLKIEELNMEYNKLTFLKVPVLYSTNKRNPSLSLGHNDIEIVDVEEIRLNDKHIEDLPSKDYENYVESTVSLYPNPFTCNCRLFEFYDYLQRANEARKRSVRFDFVQNFTCHEPKELTGKSVISLMSNQFSCNLKEDCEPPCKCYVRAHDNARIVNCSNHQLKSLPKVIPINTSVLYFENNGLTNMRGFNGKAWQNLTDLFLERNLINTLDHWQIPPKLRKLALRSNHLTHLSLTLMNFTAHADGFQMTLSDNPWNCNCSTLDLKKWLTEHYQIVDDVKRVMCAKHLKQNGTMVKVPIVTIPDDVMCPVNNWPYKIQLISVTTICVILALSLFVVSVLYYRNKQTVIAYMYIHLHHVFMCFFSEKDMDEDKIFDAFVSYSSTDQDVALMLLQELENKDPNFKLCIHERNWLPGNLISWNIINSVQNSRRTILVVSKAFLESMWFQVEFHTAYYQMLEDKMDRLIVIVKGDLPPKETLDKDLQYLLTTKTYLVWEEKWFWEKLRYAMPHKKQMIGNDIMALKDRPASDKVKNVETQIAILSSNGNKTSDKVQEVVQNGTSRALNLVNKDYNKK